MRILVADDYAITRVVLKRALAKFNYENIVEAIDGQDAFEKIQKSFEENDPVKVAFLDWNMPQMSGIEVVKNCNQDPNFQAISFVMITAERETESIAEALNAGASEYIVKPFTDELIQQKLSSILKQIEEAA